jgi:hypothetical protein
MPITMIHRNGGPYEAITCPAILCDTCGEPINAEHQTPYEARRQGLVLWDPKPYAYVDGRPTATEYAYVHKGACDRKWSKGRHLFSRELDDFMAQLAHNYTHPFEDENYETDIEYVAPAPSTWRLGNRTKTTT